MTGFRGSGTTRRLMLMAQALRGEDDVVVARERAGNADVSSLSFWDTSSAMLFAPQVRRTSSTSRDGPEMITSSERRRIERKRIPPRGPVADELEAKCGDAQGPPMVRSSPLRVPPR